MEKAIRFKHTEDTPEVIFDRTGNLMEITGRSMPEDALKFYAPLQKWIDDYLQNPNPEIHFHINLDYFNSKSLKQIIQMLIKLEGVSKKGKNVKVIWICGEHDELMQSKGEEIKSIVKLPFEVQRVFKF